MAKVTCVLALCTGTSPTLLTPCLLTAACRCLLQTPFPGSSLPPSPKQSLTCHLQHAPQGASHKYTHSTLGGSWR